MAVGFLEAGSAPKRKIIEIFTNLLDRIFVLCQYWLMRKWKRFDTQLQILLNALRADPEWRTLNQLQAVTGIRETSLSAQLRNLRKQEHGGHVVEKRRLNGCDWEYRLSI